jgi:protein phosphatase
MSLVKSGKMTLKEARTSSLKNELSQAVGADNLVNPDYISCTLRDGDKVLFCSDGLWDMLSDAEIADVLKQDKSADLLCRELVDRANNAGGKDNITVIVVIHTTK